MYFVCKYMYRSDMLHEDVYSCSLLVVTQVAKSILWKPVQVFRPQRQQNKVLHVDVFTHWKPLVQILSRTFCVGNFRCAEKLVWNPLLDERPEEGEDALDGMTRDEEREIFLASRQLWVVFELLDVSQLQLLLGVRVEARCLMTTA